MYYYVSSMVEIAVDFPVLAREWSTLFSLHPDSVDCEARGLRLMMQMMVSGN